MSALFGLIHLNGQPLAADHLEQMSAALAAHGPAGNGIWSNDQAGLGQRLMCFTPEDYFERQPLISSDGQRVLVCDARIDNRLELALLLGIPSPDVLPDSVFILRAYEKWGDECVRHLIGAFAFALWDSRQKLLMLVRSPRGERPLYYQSTAGQFAFASMPKGLFSLPSVSREIDLEYLADYLVVAPTDPGRCLYRDIRQLPAGHLLSVSRSEIKLRRYWKPDVRRELRLPSDDEYVEAFSELFERVVADHLRSASAAGVMMSGGLDSTAVAAVAAQQFKLQGKRLATFTEVPRAGFSGNVISGRYADETPFVQAMANRHDSIDLNLIRTDGRFYLDDVTTLFAMAEMPFRNASNLVWYEAIQREAGSKNVRVLLTGSPGNLTISWNGRGLLPFLLRNGRLFKAWHEAQALARQNNLSSGIRTLLGQGVMPLLPASVWRTIQHFRHNDISLFSESSPWQTYSPILPAFAQEQRVTERAREKNCDFSFRPSGNTKQERYESLVECAGNPDIGTAYQALCGVETRDPTGDMRMVEFSLSLPEEQCLQDGKSRWLLHRAMADRLPAEILSNRLRGLQAADWFERLVGAREAIQQELDRLEQSPLAASVLDLQRMRRLVEQLPETGGDADRSIVTYRGVLERGLMTGRFLRWFESGQ